MLEAEGPPIYKTPMRNMPRLARRGRCDAPFGFGRFLERAWWSMKSARSFPATGDWTRTSRIVSSVERLQCICYLHGWWRWPVAAQSNGMAMALRGRM